MSTVVRCDKCGKEQRIINKLPYGWAKLRDRIWCKECNERGAKNLLRAIFGKDQDNDL